VGEHGGGAYSFKKSGFISSIIHGGFYLRLSQLAAVVVVASAVAVSR